MAEMSEVERLLRSALVPIEPPGNLTDRLEERLTEITDAAATRTAPKRSAYNCAGVRPAMGAS
jgi:hypothetical protein